jgi:hypothetical protein
MVFQWLAENHPAWSFLDTAMAGFLAGGFRVRP